MFILHAFSKPHIFLDNRIFSKTKKSVLCSFCGPDYIFLWQKRKKEVRLETSMKFTLSWWLSIFVPAMKDMEERGSRASKFCNTLNIHDMSLLLCSSMSENGMHLQGMFQNRMLFFPSFSASALLQRAEN